MKAQIQLSDEPLIDYLSFCRAIAQALCPANGQELKGIDCVTGKLVTHNVAQPPLKAGDEKWPTTSAMQCVLLSDDGHTLDQLRLDRLDATASSTPLLPFGNELRQDVVELTLPYKLTDDDHQLMEKLLANLPALHYPMSEDEVAAFMHAYFDLPNRPAWEPILVTDAMIKQRQAKQDAIMQDHQKALQNALQNELTQERVIAVDSNHVPVARFAIGTFLPRDQAIAYLDRCGILHSDKAVGGQRVTELQTPAIHPEPLKGEQNPVTKRKLTEKQRQEAIALHHELKRQGVKKHCQQVAAEYGISDSYLRRLVRDTETKRNETRLDKIWAKSTTKKRK